MAIINSITTLEESVNAKIANGDLDCALRLIQQTVDQVNCEPINVAEIFASKLLDALCQKIGAIHFEIIRNNFTPTQYSTNSNNTVVFLASRLHESGGHNSVLGDIVRLGPPAKNVVLVTGIAGPTNLSKVHHHFKDTTAPTIELAPSGTHVKKLLWLQRRLQALAPQTVWLFNHHQDSVAVAAVQPNAGYQLRFYHHGDHHLCLGVHLGYATHIDMNPLGFHNCRQQLGIQANRYLPLTVRDLGRSALRDDAAVTQGLVTCTAAGSNKISPPYFIRYVEVIPQLIQRTGGQHIHIGFLGKLNLYRVRRRLRELRVPETKFTYIPFVESVWRALIEHKVDLYVGSFPFGGARTMIEAMGAGVPLALHQHATSRLLSGLDVADSGVITWRTPQDLYNYVQRTTRESLMSHSEAGRKKYEDCYREELLVDSLANWDIPMQPPPVLTTYATDVLQRALDTSSQFSFRGVVSRALNRMLQRLKSIRA